MKLTHISHRYCREITQMGMDTRKATEETGDVLLVRWRYPTEPDAVDMPKSVIAANICEKCGLKCRRRESNPYEDIPRQILSLMRLPIPPLRLISTHYK